VIKVQATAMGRGKGGWIGDVFVAGIGEPCWKSVFGCRWPRESGGAPYFSMGRLLCRNRLGIAWFFCNPMGEGRKVEAGSCTANELAVAPGTRRASWFELCFWSAGGRLFVRGTGGLRRAQPRKPVAPLRREQGLHRFPCSRCGLRFKSYMMSRKKLRLQQRLMPPNEIDYLEEMPTVVPAGKLLVHNNVVPAKRIGSRGFRIWYVSPDSAKYVVCDCGWAPELGEHYRINTES
jgi:hypothetical protein